MTEKNPNSNDQGAVRVRLNPDVLAQRVENELVIVHLDTNQIYNFNDSAARLWELLEAGFNLDEVRQKLTREFEVSEERLDRDISTTLASLVEHQLATLEK